MRAHRYPWRRRLAVWAAGLVAATVVIGLLDAPYATVTPGPTPELSSLVVAAQAAGADVDPTFGHGGQWYATTIDATPLKWWELARCKVAGGCRVFPLATGASARSQETEQMADSIRSAAQVAALWVGSSDHKPTMNADLGKVGGPSAGLMLTLAFIDASTDGDLTAGQRIAGTGTMNSLSEAGPVGGVEFKVAGARAAGATVFFVPNLPSEVAAARQAANGSLHVVPVSHVVDALRWLCQNGGRSTVCSSPALSAS